MADHDRDPEAAAALAVALERLGALVVRDASLAPYCTYRVGGPAAGLVAVDAVSTLERVRSAIDGAPVPVLVVGNGSNLLVADRGFPGIVLHLGPTFEEIEVDVETAMVRVGAAALLPVVARRTARAGLAGFEWAVGVPGTIGGAVRMNAGGHGSDMAASLTRISRYGVDDGGPFEREAAELDLGYRRSNLRPLDIVLFAELALEPGDPEESAQLLSEIVAWRRANQPGGQNAGSVFANPPGDSAGRLIDACGLKGYRVGSAEVSTKHANFIQADPDGSADDVYAVIRDVQRRVSDTEGVLLRPENQLVGFPPLPKPLPSDTDPDS